MLVGIGMLVGIAIAVGQGSWARRDAKTLQARGIRVGSLDPTGWFWLVTLCLIIFGPMYLFQRSKAVQAAAAYGFRPPYGGGPFRHMSSPAIGIGTAVHYCPMRATALSATTTLCPMCHTHAPLPMQSQAAPGWHMDPTNPAQYRFWDGQRWTDQTSPRT